MTNTLILDTQKFLAVQKRYALTADQMYKVGAVFQNNGIRKLPSGNFQVQSLSRPNQFHQVNPLHESCTCEHAAKNVMCFHLAAWKITQVMSDAERNAYREQFKQAQVEKRHFDDVRSAQDDDGVIAQREQAQRLERNARPKTEYVEELDLFEKEYQL